eukprot:scaffold262954_cov21-Tisochrysis_lutea.AAC.1
MNKHLRPGMQLYAGPVLQEDMTGSSEIDHVASGQQAHFPRMLVAAWGLRWDHENELAEVAIVCEPEHSSLMMGGLHPRGSLYERPVSVPSPCVPLCLACCSGFRLSRTVTSFLEFCLNETVEGAIYRHVYLHKEVASKGHTSSKSAHMRPEHTHTLLDSVQEKSVTSCIGSDVLKTDHKYK